MGNRALIAILALAWAACGGGGSSAPCGEDEPCPDGQVCNLETMICEDQECPEGEALCSAGCTDLASDADNCGQCGNMCGDGERCDNLLCVEDLTCEGGLLECEEDVCSDPTSSVEHCGECGNSCEEDEECADSQCRPRCDTFLTEPITGGRGNIYGQEREAATWQAARDDCASFGGRLPTYHEARLVSGAGEAVVGAESAVLLWTESESARNTALTVRMDNGARGAAAADTEVAYRCMCPAPSVAPGFRCAFPAADASCQSFATESVSLRLDRQNRTSLNSHGATRECLADGGRLATMQDLIRASNLGIAGTDTPLTTADMRRLAITTRTRLTTVAGAWATTDLFAINQISNAAFRCVSPDLSQATLRTGESFFTGDLLSTDERDRPATTYLAALDACVAQGGHLPTQFELINTISDGLANGSNVDQWTASHMTDSPSTVLINLLRRWTLVESEYNFATYSEVARTASQPYRCIYYPIVDEGTARPETCNGECQRLELGDGAVMWFDSTDRGALTLPAAFAACHAAGGRLPGERDLTEAIRLGLDGGLTANFLWSGTPSDSPALMYVVAWTGADNPNWTPAIGSTMAAAALTGARPYRCMWTNEVR